MWSTPIFKLVWYLKKSTTKKDKQEEVEDRRLFGSSLTSCAIRFIRCCRAVAVSLILSPCLLFGCKLTCVPTVYSCVRVLVRARVWVWGVGVGVGAWECVLTLVGEIPLNRSGCNHYYYHFHYYYSFFYQLCWWQLMKLPKNICSWYLRRKKKTAVRFL